MMKNKGVKAEEIIFNAIVESAKKYVPEVKRKLEKEGIKVSEKTILEAFPVEALALMIARRDKEVSEMKLIADSNYSPFLVKLPKDKANDFLTFSFVYDVFGSLELESGKAGALSFSSNKDKFNATPLFVLKSFLFGGKVGKPPAYFINVISAVFSIVFGKDVPLLIPRDDSKLFVNTRKRYASVLAEYKDVLYSALAMKRASKQILKKFKVENGVGYVAISDPNKVIKKFDYNPLHPLIVYLTSNGHELARVSAIADLQLTDETQIPMWVVFLSTTKGVPKNKAPKRALKVIEERAREVEKNTGFKPII